LRGGFCGRRAGAPSQLRESLRREPEDKLRFVRREKELLRRRYAGGQGATNETDRHGAMHGRFDVGVRSPRRSYPHVEPSMIGMAPCMEGSTWGYDRRGVWVDRGCNGEFLVQAVSELGAGDSSGKSWAKTVSKPVANELVRQCLQVSPATHPPCNAQNSCKLIEDEIQRGCGLLGANAPAFCGENK